MEVMKIGSYEDKKKQKLGSYEDRKLDDREKMEVTKLGR